MSQPVDCQPREVDTEPCAEGNEAPNAMDWKGFRTQAQEVVTRTCELARYLESRIAATSELELMASAQMNVVCFRYRFEVAADSPTDKLSDELSDDLSDELNRQIVVKLRESVAPAPTTTLIGSRLALRVAIVNEWTSCMEIETLIEATLAAGRALRRTAPSATPVKSEWQPWSERDAKLRELDTQLNTLGDRRKDVEAAVRARKSLPVQDARLRQLDAQIEAQIHTLRDKQRNIEIALRVKRATLLAEMGRSLEARADHLKVVELDPSHRLNLIGLGQLLETTGQHKAAQLVYSEAVKYYPEDIISRVNLGAALLKGDDPIGARTHYEAALRIAPDFLQAHGGMYYTLARLGETEAAEAHRLKCFGRQNIFPIPYRGSSQPVSVLLLVSSRGGNAPIERLLDDQVFQTYVVVMDFHDPKTPLPAHDLVINGIGDCEVAPEELAAAESLLALTPAPVLNAPASVQATSRCDIAQRLSGVPGVVTPRTMTLSRELLAASDAHTTLTHHGFEFPILLRTPGFHGGEHFLRVESSDDLPAALMQLPGRELTVIQYLDARAADGKTRKYRVMMIDGELYPLHAAISSNWKIHYFNAEMADCPEHRAEDGEFLANMTGVLGPRAIAALKEIQKILGLDYGGVDFGLNQKGEVLLFEANATMAVVPPDADQRWDYRRPAIGQIHSAVLRMLMDRADAVSDKDEQHLPMAV